MRVAGLGFRKGAAMDSLRAAIDAAGGVDGLTCLATVEAKAEAACLRALSAQLGLPIRAVSAGNLAAAPVITQSEKSKKMYGTGSVSEAAALAVAGPGGKLLAPRTLSPDKMATCAIAEGGGT